MRRIVSFCGALALMFALATAARAQSSPATTCPTNYICSLALTGSAPLIGAATDGQPISLLGFVSFDASGNVSGTVELNANGTIHSLSGVTGTCTSGTTSTLGSIQVPIPGNGQLTIDFVTTVSAGGIDLLLADHSTTQTNDAPVTLGVCHASAAG